MKKISALVIGMLVVTASLLANPSAKMLKVFNEAFPNAQNVKWHEDEKGFLVSFTESGIITKVNYDKTGNFINSLRYYNESKLPMNILMAVKTRFPEKDIFGVTEFATKESVTYHIKIQDDKRWYTVKADADGTLQVEEKYKKQQEKK